MTFRGHAKFGTDAFHSKKPSGFTLIGFMLASSLISIVMLMLGNVFDLVAKGNKTGHSKSSLELASNMAGQQLLNPLTCSCVMAAANSGAGLILNNDGSGNWTANAASLSGFSVGPFGPGCGAGGSPFLTDGQNLPGSTDIAIGIGVRQISEVVTGTKFQFLLDIKGIFSGNILGSKETVKTVPLVVTATTVGLNATVTACSDEGAQIETTPAFLSWQGPNAVRLLPVNQSANKLTLRMNDGSVREMIPAVAGAWPTWLANNAMIDGVAATTAAASTLYSLYAIPSSATDFTVVSSLRGAASAAGPIFSGPSGQPVWAYLGSVYILPDSSVAKFFQTNDEFTIETNAATSPVLTLVDNWSAVAGGPVATQFLSIPFVPASAVSFAIDTAVKNFNSYAFNPATVPTIAVGAFSAQMSFFNSVNQPLQENILGNQRLYVENNTPQFKYQVPAATNGYRIVFRSYKDQMLPL